MEQVILVDEQDNEIGVMEKMEAHQKGLLHRAFSVLLFNNQGELLLQKRASTKYHSGGLWTNTCCSHPMPNENILDAAKRKLYQEMGIQTEMEFAYKFIYTTSLDNNLIENELDYVLIGNFDGKPQLNPAEASDWKFASLESIKEDMISKPDNYTVWFKKIIHHPNLTKVLV
jgi:isopentenyl-diphosphate delta-isomerase